MKTAILVIDRFGLIGEPLSLKLSQEFPVVFVSKKNLNLNEKNRNIVCAPFSRKFPIIPDSKYSHIVFIDEEGLDLELLPKIINKVRDVNADFIFAQGLSSKGEYAVSRILRLYSSAKVVLFGDIFDNKLIPRRESLKSVINRFIYQAQKFGKIQLLGEGLRDVYPVALGDVVDGLIEIVFGMHRSSSLFYIFPKPAVTELSLAHMIQKINPEVTVDFIKHDPRLKEASIPSGGQNILGRKYPLAKKIRGIDIKMRVKTQDEDRDGNTKKIKRFPFFMAWILLFLLILPFISAIFFSFLGSSTFYYAKREMDRGNFVSAKSSLHLSQAFFSVGKQALNIFSFQAKAVGREASLKKLSLDLDLGYKISETLFQAFNSEIYFSKILNGKSKNPMQDFTKGGNYLRTSMITLSKIGAEEKIPALISQSLETVNPLIKLLSATLDIMPNIFGMEGPKTYLILFQDNMELRPGGGLIGAYGILRFDMGRVTEFSVHDVYDADKELKGHVEPPFAIRRHLPEQHWYMKDSNFDVDFVKVASSSSNFLFVETGQKVSGVISVDSSFAKSILHAIGPVYLEDYRETVNESNLYMLIQSHAKKNFLRSLYKAIMAKITKEKTPFLLIARAISDSLEQKHLMFTFNDWQNTFTVNGWSSSLWDGRRDSEESVNDFIGINEANLGLNKTNYFIRRQISQKVTLEDNGSISEELQINYKNESTAFLGGDYKNYLRIILPKNTLVSEISINDVAQDIVDAVTDPLVYEAKNFKEPEGIEVEKTSEGNKDVFGFLVRVPAEGMVKVKLKYSLPGNISGLNTFSYSLKLFKQPGVDNIPYSFSLIYPESFNIVKGSDGIRREEGKASYSEKITGDKNLIVNFAKR